MTPAWLSFSKQPSQTNWKIQGAPESTARYPIRPIRPIPSHFLPYIPNPKSTLGCERLIKGENGLRPPLSATRHKPIIRPENKGIKPKSNRHRPKNFITGRYSRWPSANGGSHRSRSVAVGRAWSRPFRKKKIVYFL